jgi:hypothetical protein
LERPTSHINIIYEIPNEIDTRYKKRPVIFGGPLLLAPPIGIDPPLFEKIEEVN